MSSSLTAAGSSLKFSTTQLPSAKRYSADAAGCVEAATEGTQQRFAQSVQFFLRLVQQ